MNPGFRHVAPALLVLGCYHAGAPGEPLRGSSAQEPQLAALVVANGTLMFAGYSGVIGNVVLGRNEQGGLEIVEVGPTTVTSAADTLDASGLFVHSGNALVAPPQISVGSPGMLLLRTGPSPGDSIAISIDYSGRTPIRRLASEDNRPGGDRHPVVGCYHVERSEWDDPKAAASLQRVVLPESVRLHWQYAGLTGREKVLVATDIAGRLPGEHTVYYFWRPFRADTVLVNFGTGYESAQFRLAPHEEHLTGVVIKSGHTVPGPWAEARVIFTRVPCM